MIRRHVNTPSGVPEDGAAPAGGPATRGRGCSFIYGFAACACLSVAGPAAAELAVPSGQPIAFHDEITDAAQPGAHRFRFVAPEIGAEGLGYHEIEGDFGHLCQEYALDALSTRGAAASEILITLMREPVVFGEITPGVPQFFERFTVQNGLCIWEAF